MSQCYKRRCEWQNNLWSNAQWRNWECRLFRDSIGSKVDYFFVSEIAVWTGLYRTLENALIGQSPNVIGRQRGECMKRYVGPYMAAKCRRWRTAGMQLQADLGDLVGVCHVLTTEQGVNRWQQTVFLAPTWSSYGIADITAVPSASVLPEMLSDYPAFRRAFVSNPPHKSYVIQCSILSFMLLRAYLVNK